MGGRGAKAPATLKMANSGIPRTIEEAIKRLDSETETVPFDSWGEVLPERYDPNGIQIKGYDDGLEVTYGDVYDTYEYNSEEDIKPITKKAILEDIDAWRNDDGTYGDSDTSIQIYYSDGKYVNVDELDGKLYKKSGIIGAAISTGDYESVWGRWQDKNGKRQLLQTWSEDGESGATNSYSGYKQTKKRRARKMEVSVPNGKGGYKRVYKTLKRSEWVDI